MNLKKTRDKLKKSALGFSFLYILCALYFLLYKTRAALYALNLLPKKSVPAKVICVGNISAGGTGKTTAVIELAKKLYQKNKKVAVIMRGYNRLKKTASTLILSKENPSSVDITGDEAALINENLKDLKIPVLIDPDRAAAAQKAAEYGAEIILMDDGFQHFALKRDTDLVLVNAKDSLNEYLLPLGDLRETYFALKRAKAVILTHCELACEEKINFLKTKIKKKNPNCPIFCAKHSFDRIFNPLNASTLTDFQNKEFCLLSSIGDPESFEKNVLAQKIKVKNYLIFPDHHNFSLKDLLSVSEIFNGSNIMTTYKDFVKFPKEWPEIFKDRLHIFSIKMEFNKDDEEKLLEMML